MLERHAKPMETSSPVDVVSPLWQGKHRSEVWKIGPLAFWAGALWPDVGDETRITAAMRAAEQQIRIHRNTSVLLLPTLGETSVEPVPQHVKHELPRPAEGVVYGKPNAQVSHDVLAPAERYLELR